MRELLQLFSLVYWRLQRTGRDHIPRSGPAIIVANHRSFLDPFIVGLTARRPVYYVAKQELFRNRLFAWFISSLGASWTASLTAPRALRTAQTAKAA
jgi:glycerol-3-phosphate dehydrogenase (NAD(P)+)